MGLDLHAVIVASHGHADAEALIAACGEELPHATARRFTDPFDGVMAWADRHEDDGDETRGNLEDRLPGLSRRFPERRFVLVEVECFGGTCLYSGHVVAGGQRGRYVPPSQRGHLELFARAGLPHDAWHFAPFTREFLGGGAGQAPPERRPIEGVLEGVIHGELRRLHVALAADLAPPWRTWVIGDTTFVEHGDADVLVSLREDAGAIELRGRAHAALPAAVALMTSFVVNGPDVFSMPHDIALSTFERAPVHRWRSP